MYTRIKPWDSKYSGSFDQVFLSEGARVIKTPAKVPKANAFAERFVGTVRRELLDRILILGPRHLDVALSRFAEHYNAERTHRGLHLGSRIIRCPSPRSSAFPRWVAALSSEG